MDYPWTFIYLLNLFIIIKLKLMTKPQYSKYTMHMLYEKLWERLKLIIKYII